MISNSLIVIPFNTKRFWQADYIQRTCNVLSKKNKVIAFLWADSKSFKEIFLNAIFKNKSFGYIRKTNNITYFTPIHFLPLRRYRYVVLINCFINTFVLRTYIRILHPKSNKYLWIFHPEFQLFIDYFGKNYFSIYDCVDYFSSQSLEINNRFRSNEKSLLKKSDAVFVNSNILYKLHKSQRVHIVKVPQGFSHEIFRLQKKQIKTQFPFPTNKPLIGFIGGLNSRINYDLLRKLVRNYREINFLFIGPERHSYDDQFIGEVGQAGKFYSSSNVFLINKQPKRNIPNFIRQLTITMIPYNSNLEFNKYCYPMKLFEYFYMGKPVVSTPIEELKRFPKFVKIGRTAEEWEKIIKKLLGKPWPENYKREQRKLAIENSWENKIEAISKVIEKKYTDPS